MSASRCSLPSHCGKCLPASHDALASCWSICATGVRSSCWITWRRCWRKAQGRVACVRATRAMDSCCAFAQKGPCLTLVQDNLDRTVGEQRAKATAHIASPGVGASEADALHAFVRQLDAPRNRPHLLDQPHDAKLTQPWRALSEPVSCPYQEIVG